MAELMTQGVELMFMGMLIVYAFLGMLIGGIKLMSTVLLRYFPEPLAIDASDSNDIDQHRIAAISAAVHQYRNKHK